MTYTYAILEVSPGAFAEIKTALEAAGYEEQFHRDDGRLVIDMHGIAVAEKSNPQPPEETHGSLPKT